MKGGRVPNQNFINFPYQLNEKKNSRLNKLSIFQTSYFKESDISRDFIQPALFFKQFA